MAVKVNLDSCIGCGACVGVCPTEALSLDDDHCVCDEDLCAGCGTCVETCPVGALTLD